MTPTVFERFMLFYCLAAIVMILGLALNGKRCKGLRTALLSPQQGGQMGNETTSPEVATRASRVLRDAHKLLDKLGSIRTNAVLTVGRCDEMKHDLKAILDDARSAAASALTQREPSDGRRLYSVEVIGYSTAWHFEQLATEEQAQAWREDGLHVEELVVSRGGRMTAYSHAAHEEYKTALHAMSDTVDALAIILTCPLWPDRGRLNPEGRALYDAILGSAKPYARALASNEPEAALAMASGWTPLVAAYMESTRINDPDLGENNRRLLAVYTHYMDRFADWGQIRG